MKKLPKKLSCATGLLILATQQIAIADVLPGSAMPEQVGRALYQQQPVATSTAPAPILKQAQHQPSPLGPEAEKIKFKLNGIVIDGNHVFSDEQLKPLYESQLHKTISVAQLFDIVQNITNFYRNNGYIISRAILPPQHVKNGVVHIQIVEGFIGSVSVTGNPRGAQCIVQAYGEKIKQCPPLQLNRMEHYLLIANETPGTQVRSVLSPSQNTVGAADLTLVTNNDPITGYVSYDNYGTRYIGPQQMTANVALNSLLRSGDSLQTTLTKTPKGNELTYNDINYSAPLSAEGIRWLIGGTRVSTNPLFVLEPSKIQGLNWNYYTSLLFPVIRSRTESLTFQAGFNYLDSRVTTLGAELYTDHIRSIGLSGTYNFSDRWYGSNLIMAQIRQGLPIWDYTSDTDPLTAQTSNPGGHAVYTTINLELSRLQALRGPFSIYGVIKGQTSFEQLLASEQFTFGGPIIGRGYDVAELIGDRGVAGSLELRYDTIFEKLALQSVEFYIFYDAGMVWNFLGENGIPIKQSATSTGIGVRFFFNKFVSGNLMWAQPLTKQVAAEELIGDGWRPRTFFSLVASVD